MPIAKRFTGLLAFLIGTQLIHASEIPSWFKSLILRDEGLTNYRAAFTVESWSQGMDDDIDRLKEFSKSSQIAAVKPRAQKVFHWDLAGGWRAEVASGSVAGAPGFGYGSSEPLISEDRVVFSPPDSGRVEVYGGSILGRHPVLAAGASQWRNVKFTGTGLNRVEAIGPQGERLVLIADPATNRPVSLEVQQGEYLKRYRYSDWSKTDFEFPTKVSFELISEGKAQATELFSEIEIQPGKAAVSPVTDWLKPGRIIEDQRVKPVVQFSYEELVGLSGGKTALTGDELLVFSKAKAETEAKKQAWEKRMEGKTENPSLPSWMLIGLGLVLAGGGLLFWTKFRPKAL
jgi:hypothetical protein